MRGFLVTLLVLGAVFQTRANDDFSFGLELEGWSTEAGITVDNLTLEQSGIGAYNDKEILPSLSAIFQYKSFFAKLTRSLATDFIGKANRVVNNEESNNLGGVTRSTLAGGFNTKLEREDTDISFGYAWTIGLTVFGGYKKIRLDEAYLGQSFIFTVEDFDSNDVLFDTQTFDVTSIVNWFSQNRYDYDGPFLGLGYARQLGSSDFGFEVSAAYADLSGDFVPTSTITLNGEPVESTLAPEGLDAKGISWRLGFSYNITSSFSAGVAFKSQDYQSDTSGFLAPDFKSDGLSVRLRYMF